jgi:hypothetical protein
MDHDGCTIGSKRDDKSYAAPGIEEADGRSAIENGGDVTSAGGGGGGGDGTSIAARWACKYESSACKFTTC